MKVCYDTEDTDRHIQNFYAIRKDALIELSRSMRPLLSYAQWVGFKKASPETLDQMEALALRTDILPPYRMIRHLQLIYGSLQNELLMRMVWQIFMFFQAPLFSIRFTARRYEGDNSLLYMDPAVPSERLGRTPFIHRNLSGAAFPCFVQFL